ncbi:hypothetical protein EV182_005153, partial [Spiromyces aspiralis]
SNQARPTSPFPVSQRSIAATTSNITEHQWSYISKSLNPFRFDQDTSKARFFVIKSYTEENVRRSVMFSLWTSTEPGNQRLDRAFREQQTIGGQ